MLTAQTIPMPFHDSWIPLAMAAMQLAYVESPEAAAAWMAGGGRPDDPFMATINLQVGVLARAVEASAVACHIVLPDSADATPIAGPVVERERATLERAPDDWYELFVRASERVLGPYLPDDFDPRAQFRVWQPHVLQIAQGFGSIDFEPVHALLDEWCAGAPPHHLQARLEQDPLAHHQLRRTWSNYRRTRPLDPRITARRSNSPKQPTSQALVDQHLPEINRRWHAGEFHAQPKPSPSKQAAAALGQLITGQGDRVPAQTVYRRLRQAINDNPEDWRNPS